MFWMVLGLTAYFPTLCCSSEVTFLAIDSDSGLQSEEKINEEQVPLFAANNLVDVINAIFASGSTTHDRYYKYFGLEPESPASQDVPNEESTFLHNSKILLGEDFEKVKLLTWETNSIWRVGVTGDYSFYAVRLSIANSARFRTGILLFRTETIQSENNKVLSAKPSALYLGR